MQGCNHDHFHTRPDTKHGQGHRWHYPDCPEGWVLLPPGDAALTRRVKAAGEHWVVQEKRGRKIFSRGVWAPSETIESIRQELEAERATEGFARKKEADARRREKAQTEYVEDFQKA